MRKIVSLLSLSLMGMSFGSAADSAVEEIESIDAHVHGVAQLQIVAENNTVEMHFESPAMNIVGFEHDVTNQEHAEKLKESLAMLVKGDELFVLAGGLCSFIGTMVENPFEEAGGHDHGEHHDEKHKTHHNTLEHREFAAEYKATCQDLSKLSRIDLRLFDVFGRIESLDIQYVVRGKQGAVMLTQTKPFLELPK